MTLISPKALKAKIDNKEDFQLIDVRENYQFEEFNIGGINIPLGQVFSSLDKMDNKSPIVFCCNSGRKSKAIIHTIKRKLNLDNVYNLEGGFIAYTAEIINT